MLPRMLPPRMLPPRMRNDHTQGYPSRSEPHAAYQGCECATSTRRVVRNGVAKFAKGSTFLESIRVVSLYILCLTLKERYDSSLRP